jgi:hypothetical protein
MPPFKTATPRAYKDEKGTAGLIDAEWMKDAEERLRNPHVDPREYGAVCDSTGAAGSGTDDSKALEEAITAAIEQKRPLFIPGKMRSSKALKAVTDYFEIFGLGWRFSQIVADNSTFDALTIGPGAPGSGNRPGGFIRDLAIAGGNASIKTAGVATVTGKAALKLDGMRLFEVRATAVIGAHDIGFDLVHNCFGTEFHNARADLECCRVGVNLRKGEESGEDLLFENCWLAGEVCAIHAASSAKNYRVIGGQLSAARQNTVEEDLRGVVILCKDYLTGETVAGGEVHMQLQTSFEFFPKIWAIRSFGRVHLDLRSSFNPNGAGGPGIGFFKGSSLVESVIRMDTCNIHGKWIKYGSEIVKLEGTNSDFQWKEIGSWGIYENSAGSESTHAEWEPLWAMARITHSTGSTSSGDKLHIGNGIIVKYEGEAIKWSRDWGSTWKYLTPEGKTYASANTLTLDHGIALAKITGTTAIKKIEPTFEGHKVVLKFAASCTLTNGENLKLGVSLNAVENDAIALVCDGTNWYRVGAAATGYEEVASAGTISLSRGVSAVKLTGTAEVKKINATVPGHRVSFIFKETAKLVLGENLKIGATFSGTADDVIELVCDGTNWYRVAVGAVN